MFRFASSSSSLSSSLSVLKRRTSLSILPNFCFLHHQKRFQSSTTKNSNHNKVVDDDDDFVPESAFLNLMTEEKTSNDNNNNLPQIIQPLGIERLPDIPEGTRFSRMNKIVSSQPAPTIASQRKASLDEASEEEIAALLHREEFLQKIGKEGQAFRLSQDAATVEEEGEGEEGNKNNSKIKKTTTENGLEEEYLADDQDGTQNLELPYDDPNFAEAILKMEVEGALDETWQETVQAKPEDVAEIVEVLKDSRARDIVAIDVRTKTSSFDFIVVATCDSQRHMTLASWSVSEADKWNRISKPTRRKSDELWDIVPVGRILVNLMVESYRNEVSVERKWAITKSMDPLDVAHTKVSESRQVRMHGLWTLTMNLQDLEDFEVDYCKDVLLSQL